MSAEFYARRKDRRQMRWRERRIQSIIARFEIVEVAPALEKPKKALSRGKTNLDSHVSRLLAGITAGKKILEVAKGARVFSQGGKTDAIYFIETGKVKISVLSTGGKEAVLVILGPQDFLG